MAFLPFAASGIGKVRPFLPISRDSFDVIVVLVRLFSHWCFCGCCWYCCWRCGAEVQGESKADTCVIELIDELAAPEAALAEILDMKFFCGFTCPEIAVMKNTFERTARRQWEKAHIYLHRKLSTDLGD